MNSKYTQINGTITNTSLIFIFEISITNRIGFPTLRSIVK